MLERSKSWVGRQRDTISEIRNAGKRAEAAKLEELGGKPPITHRRSVRVAATLLAGGVSVTTCSALRENGGAELVQEAVGEGVGETAGATRTGFNIVSGAAGQTASELVGDCPEIWVVRVGSRESCSNGNTGNSGGSGEGDGAPPIITVGPSGGDAPRSVTVQPGWGATNVLRQCGIEFSYSDVATPWGSLATRNAGIILPDPNNPGLDPGEQIVC